MENEFEIKQQMNHTVIIERIKQFLESKWFIFLLGFITLGCWLINVVYLPYIILCLLILLMTIVKAQATSIIALLMLYLAGNSSGVIKTSGAGFVFTVIAASLAVAGVLFRYFSNFKENSKKIFSNKIIIALLILTTTMLISIINSPVKLHSLEMTGVFMLNILVSAITLLCIKKDDNAKQLIAISFVVFMLVISLEFGVNIIKQFDNGTKLWELLKGKRIDVGWMLGNHFVVIINISLAMCSYLFIISKKWWHKSILVFLALLGVCAEILTLSRGGFLGLFVLSVSIFIVLICSVKSKKTIFLSIISTILVLTCAILVFNYYGLIDDFINHFKHMGASENGRNRIWKMAIELFRHNWIIGTGWGTSRYYLDTILHDWVYNYHNYFLQISTCGILGIISFAIYLLTTINQCFSKKVFSLVVISVFIMFLVHGFVDTLFFNKDLMLILSILVIVGAKSPKNGNYGVDLKMRKSIQESLTMKYSLDLYKNKIIFSFIKRTFDILSSSIALILLSWVFIIIAIILKLTSKGPVFYGHSRIGKNGKMFKVWKFRSMKVDNRPLEEILTKEQLEEYKRDFKVTNDPRVTKVGKFLRKTSLDELPQLWNIFTGKMSVVGWRPILPEELERYGENKSLLLRVKPGLSGYWASHGRSDITYDDRMKMELYYTIKRSVWMDIRIIFHTIIGVFKRDGAK